MMYSTPSFSLNNRNHGLAVVAALETWTLSLICCGTVERAGRWLDHFGPHVIIHLLSVRLVLQESNVLIFPSCTACQACEASFSLIWFIVLNGSFEQWHYGRCSLSPMPQTCSLSELLSDQVIIDSLLIQQFVDCRKEGAAVSLTT